VIGRVWHGWATPEQAPRYEEHLRTATFPALGAIDGHAGAWALRRDAGGEVEYLVLTLWRSLDAVRAFAGDDYEVAVVPADARAALTRFDETVQHFEVAVEGGAG
jgi:heme-degrading monooxygenase HmoA